MAYSPSISAETAKERYPNPFFDLSQQYLPPTIRELFKWCTFYYYNSPLIGSAIKKVSRYPITDLIFEDPSDSIRGLWKKILVKELKIKDRLMEINLDFHAFGNAFVSLFLPFVRYLKCGHCGNTQPIKQWDWKYTGSKLGFYGTCSKCSTTSALKVIDKPLKSIKGVRLIRWNPQNITIKYNEYTGNSIYLYTVPRKLRTAVQRGDKDIIEDLPLLVLDAVREGKKIKLNSKYIKHLKNVTLAEEDQGWGKPTIIHVLKDMYYFYTLRRAQEAIALEHIVPFDIIYPLPNAQQDPYIHSDLGTWRSRIEEMIKKHRKDPNYKAVIPVPVGHSRVGGDGRALMLSPEMNYLTQTIVGGMGLPNEFIFGGLSYTGSSISLRTLENDFIQNRTQLLDLVVWLKDILITHLSLPDVKDMRFADFRMADDVQRNQQLVGLNAQGKLSNQTLLTELGFDYESEMQKILEETYMQNMILSIQSKGQARSQGEAQVIGFNYNQKVQELAERAQQNAQNRLKEQKISIPSNLDNNNTYFKPQLNAPQQIQAKVDPMTGQPIMDQMTGQPLPDDTDAKAQEWATQLVREDQQKAIQFIEQIKAKAPDIGTKIENHYYNMLNGQAMSIPLPTQQTDQQNSPMPEQDKANKEAVKQTEDMNGANMTPMPNQKPPRRSGAV